jgi:formylglycine-generating enzyme required for sulfatase activity
MFLNGRFSQAGVARLLGLVSVLVSAAGASAQAPAPFAVTLPKTVAKIEMVPVKGGVIVLDAVPGKAEKASVTVKPFWIAKTELTWDQYDPFSTTALSAGAAAGATGADAVSRPSRPYVPADLGWGHAGFPVINVTPYSGETYCKWLSLVSGKKFRLPTEAEWELACRAGAAPATLVVPAALAKSAWYDANGGGQTHAVAKKAANALGLFDMIGNAGEWCVGRDGKPVLCGGSWNDKAPQVGPGARAWQTSAWNETDPQIPKSKWWLSDGSFCGFRVVCEP